jgi:3-isopropylmalate dehydrogenase
MMPGDGIGSEVMEAANLVLDALKLDAEFIPLEIGWVFWCREGDPLPKRTIDSLKTCDCALMGAVTSKTAAEAEKELDRELRNANLVYRSPIVALRQIFDLYVNLRPCKAILGLPSLYRNGIDIVIFRENTEGLYSGVEFHPLPAEVREVLNEHSSQFARFNEISSEEIAVSLRIITRKGAHRIVRRAFEYAEKFGYPTVTIAEKPNVLRETSGMMIHEARSIAAEFKRIKLRETNIDAQMMWLVKNPEDFGVIVTSNMFGDILSDLAAQLIGGLGFSASGNIGDNFAVFEPTHGSAPKYIGLYKVNPTAMLLASKMMLDWLGEIEKGRALEKAISDVVADGKIRTYDMGGSSKTLDMAKAVIACL